MICSNERRRERAHVSPKGGSTVRRNEELYTPTLVAKRMARGRDLPSGGRRNPDVASLVKGMKVLAASKREPNKCPLRKSQRLQ